MPPDAPVPEAAACPAEQERLRAQLARLQEAHDLYRQMVNSSAVVLRWNQQGRAEFINEHGLELFGYAWEEVVGRPLAETIVPPVDTDGRDLAAMLEDLARRPEAYAANENENRTKDGRRLWLAWRNRVLPAAQGQPLRILSVGMDLTERRRAEASLRESEAAYRILFQSSPVALAERELAGLKSYLAELRRQGVEDWGRYLAEDPGRVNQCFAHVRTVQLNRAYLKLFEVEGLAFAEADRAVAARNQWALSRLGREVIPAVEAGSMVSWQREEAMYTASGGLRHLLMRSTVVPGYESQGRVLVAYVDITALKQAEAALQASQEEYRQLSVRDAITGIYNQRHLHRELPRLLEWAAGAGEPVSLLFLDLDHFKRVVDAHGHLNGSRVIREVAQVLESGLEPPAFAVAYAGDEFVCVLPGSDLAAALATAEDLRRSLGRREFLQDQGLGLKLSASFGAASFPAQAAGAEELLAAADRALFGVKAAGKNRVAAAG
jgi:diguanylate cyclase (GGDEF)-like protein/PAS domain S-box-containing protein